MLIMHSSVDTKEEILQERGVLPECSQTNTYANTHLQHGHKTQCKATRILQYNLQYIAWVEDAETISKVVYET